MTMSQQTEKDHAQHLHKLKWPSAPPLDWVGDVPPNIQAAHHHPSSSSSGGDHHQHEKKKRISLQAERTALLVVDVQPEYWSQCPAVRQDFPEFPERLGATVETCRRQKCAKVIWVRADYRYSHSPWLTQFARIHNLSSSSSNDATTAAPDNNNNIHNKNMRTEVPCDPNEFTWEDFATPEGGEIILPKSSWSSTSNTALMEILRAAQVDTVLVCGLITSVCVQHSAFGIFEAGYRTILVTDACADRGRARHEAALALYGDYMYELISSTALAASLQLAKPLFVVMPPPHSASAVSAAPPLPQSNKENTNKEGTTTTTGTATMNIGTTITTTTTKPVYSPVLTCIKTPSSSTMSIASSTMSIATSELSLSSLALSSSGAASTSSQKQQQQEQEEDALVTNNATNDATAGMPPLKI